MLFKFRNPWDATINMVQMECILVHTYLNTPYRLLLFVGRIDVGMVGIQELE